jgi:hypothetical protein
MLKLLIIIIFINIFNKKIYVGEKKREREREAESLINLI